MRSATHPVFASLQQLATDAPVVVAHRGDSRAHPENTLPAFNAANSLGVAMQEFDVRSTRDLELVCMHDASLDRTTDAATRLGPGALVALTTFAELNGLDAGTWHYGYAPGVAIPTLAQALAAMLPACVPLIEHKAGTARSFVQALQRLAVLPQCILQSFDWSFVAAAHELAPDLALAVLGPTVGAETPDAATIRVAQLCGAGMVHWQADLLTSADVDRIHAAGLLVCTYTTDDEPGLRGGAAMGFDAMCTNVPSRMLDLRRGGGLARSAQNRPKNQVGQPRNRPA